MKTSTIVVPMAALLASAVAFGQGPKPLEPAPGVAVGAKAPAFRLKDQEGVERPLDELVKSGTVALVFYRSADW